MPVNSVGPVGGSPAGMGLCCSSSSTADGPSLSSRRYRTKAALTKSRSRRWSETASVVGPAAVVLSAPVPVPTPEPAPAPDPLWSTPAAQVPVFQWLTTRPVPARVVSVYDGDTLTALVRAEDVWAAVPGAPVGTPAGPPAPVPVLVQGGSPPLVKLKCRLLGIDTPELRSKDPSEAAKARQARDVLVGWVLEKPDIWLWLKGADKYGRTLALVVRRPLGGGGPDETLNDTLMQQGWAKPYDGKGARPSHTAAGDQPDAED